MAHILGIIRGSFVLCSFCFSRFVVDCMTFTSNIGGVKDRSWMLLGSSWVSRISMQNNLKLWNVQQPSLHSKKNKLPKCHVFRGCKWLQYLAVSFFWGLPEKRCIKRSPNLGLFLCECFLFALDEIACRFKKEIFRNSEYLEMDPGLRTVSCSSCLCFVELFGWRGRVTWRKWHEVRSETCLFIVFCFCKKMDRFSFCLLGFVCFRWFSMWFISMLVPFVRILFLKILSNQSPIGP